MGMLPEIQLNFHRDSHVEENLFSWEKSEWIYIIYIILQISSSIIIL